MDETFGMQVRDKCIHFSDEETRQKSCLEYSDEDKRTNLNLPSRNRGGRKWFIVFLDSLALKMDILLRSPESLVSICQLAQR